jgi:uncharacterized protein
VRVAVSGSGGLIGSAVAEAFAAGGDDVVRLVRGAPSPGEAAARWIPKTGTVDAAALGAVDAVIHLAGENIASGRWSASRKDAIRESRVKGTRRLCESLAGLASPPATLVCASAVGYYGDRGDDLLTEESGPGAGFLPEVCREWEAACDPAVRCGTRVVSLRFGVVLAPSGGALSRMLPLFRAGLGGTLGGGRQYVSWLALGDVAPIVRHVLECDELRGPVNAVAPRPVTNRELTDAMGEVLSRPVLLPVPAFALRLALGEMAEVLLLSSCRAVPRRLEASGYRFRFPELREALRSMLGPAG